MELSIGSKKIIDKQIFSIGTYFVFSFLLACNLDLMYVIAFNVPLLVIGFACGYKYIVTYFLALVLSCFLYSYNQIVLIISITSFSILFFASLLKIKSRFFMPVVINVVIIFYCFVFDMGFDMLIITSCISLFHSIVYRDLIPVFMHKSIDVLNDRRWSISLMIILLCIGNLYSVNEMYMLLVLRYVLMLCIFYLGIQITIPCIFYIFIMLLIQNISLQQQLLGILLPSFIYFLFLPKNKYKFASIYLLSHIVLPFFIPYDLLIDSFLIIFSSLLFVTTPYFQSRDSLLNVRSKELTLKNKLINKANNFSDLFKQLSNLFQDTSEFNHVDNYFNYIYQDVCKNCTSNSYCYNKNTSTDRLVKLIKQGVEDGLSLSDCGYIESNCVKPGVYLNSVNSYHNNYIKSKKVNNEHMHLKQNLFNELSIIGNVFENFGSSLYYVNSNESMILEHLLGYQFKIEYLKKHQISINNYTIEIGIMNANFNLVHNELIPILETYLSQSLTIKSMKESIPYLGYASVVLEHKNSFNLEFGIQQISSELDYCGDSYISFKDNNKKYFAISDGMGHGKKASIESKLTLDILSKLITNGISLEDTLDSINALLRIKNKSDMYTTLDLLTIDEDNSKISFIKYGAFNSYYIYDGDIDVIQNNSLPVGVVEDIKMTLFEATIRVGDIIILCSDGVGDYFKMILQKEMSNFKLLSAQEISSILIQKVKQYNSIDDATIFVVKINEYR